MDATVGGGDTVFKWLCPWTWPTAKQTHSDNWEAFSALKGEWETEGEHISKQA